MIKTPAAWRAALAIVFFSLWLVAQTMSAASSALVFQTDFGMGDGAVAAMKGVAFSVDADLKQFDLTHDIPAYNVWQAAYRLKQTVPFWPKGTVFVSVVDPDVGTARHAVVLKTKSGHFIVTPDNGTLTFVAEELGIEEIREIDPVAHRRPGSEDSNTFHGRDVFSLVGAKLAAGKIRFSGVGKKLDPHFVSIPYQHAELKEGVLRGNIPVIDLQYGNVWSNIGKPLFDKLSPQAGDVFEVKIFKDDRQIYTCKLPYVATFGDVAEGQPLLYLNSLFAVSLALNRDDFSRAHGIDAGPDWTIEVRKVPVVAVTP